MTVAGDLLDDLSGLVDHLRIQRFALSIEDELRLFTLRGELRSAGGAPRTVGELVQLVAPVVCRNPDEQERMPEVFDRWLAPVAQAAREREAASVADTPVQAAPSEAGAAPPRRSRRLVLVGLAVVALVLLIVIVRSRSPSEAPTPTPTAAATATTQPGEVTAPVAAPPAPDGGQVTLALLPLAMGAAVIMLRRRRGEQAIARGMAPRDAGSEAMTIAAGESVIFRPGAIRAALRDLGRHQLLPSQDIDAPRSIALTARGGGFPRLVNRRRHALPDYLLLNDRVAADDHLGDLADVLATRLAAEQMHVARGEYFGDPRRVALDQPDGTRATLDLSDVREDHPHARLLIVADPAAFRDPVRRRWRDWVADLADFDTTVVLTPLPRAAWGEREQEMIGRGFRLVPATSDGLAELAQALRDEGDRDAPRASPAGADPLDRLLTAEPYRWLADTVPAAAEIDALVAALSGRLGPGALLHLSALAVFPTLRPRLTEHVGQALTLADGAPAMTGGGLAALAQLPWLRRGRMPDWLRKALIERLDPAQAAQLRAVWTALLAPAPTTGGQPLAIDLTRPPDELAELRERIARAIRGGAAPALDERILLAFLEGRPLPDLAVAAPDRLAGGSRRARLDRRDWMVMGAAAIVAMLFWSRGGAMLGGVAAAAAPLPMAVRLLAAPALATSAFFWAWIARLRSDRRSALAGLCAVLALAACLLAVGDGARVTLMLLGGSAAAATYAFGRPGRMRAMLDGVDFTRVFAGDRWWLTSLFLMASLLLQACFLGVAVADMAGGKAPEALALTPGFAWLGGTSASALIVALIAWRAGRRLERSADFWIACARMSLGLTWFVGAWMTAVYALIPPATDTVTFQADTLISLPLYILAGRLAYADGSRAARAAAWLAGAATVLKATMLISDIKSDAVLFGCFAVAVPPLAILIAVGRGPGRRGVLARLLAFAAVAALVCGSIFAIQAINDHGILVSTMQQDAARNTALIALLWSLPLALSWPMLRVVAPGLWQAQPRAAPLLQAGERRWAALVLALTVTIDLPVGARSASLWLAPLLVPLTLWLVRSIGWQRAASVLALAGSPLLIDLGIQQGGIGLGIGGSPGLYLLVLLLARFAGDGRYADRCLETTTLPWRDMLILTLALGTVGSLSIRLAPFQFGLSWQMFWLQNGLLLMAGMTAAPLRRLAGVMAVGALVSVPVFVAGGAWRWPGGVVDAQMIGPLALVPQLAGNAAMLALGRVIRRAVAAPATPRAAASLWPFGRIEGLETRGAVAASLFAATLAASTIWVTVPSAIGMHSFQPISTMPLFGLAVLAGAAGGRAAVLPIGGFILIGTIACVAVGGLGQVDYDLVGGVVRLRLGLGVALDLLPDAIAALLVVQLLTQVRITSIRLSIEGADVDPPEPMLAAA